MQTEWTANFSMEDEVALPYIFIQWKGTELCADLHCTCGAHLHMDAMFCYFVECGHCGTVWELEPTCRLREADPAETTHTAFDMQREDDR